MRKAFRYNMTLLAACALLAGLTSTSFVQSDLASVNGVVRDASGAVIPNANVTLHNQDNGAERKTTTSPAGSYTITSLPAGTYTLIAEASGFKRFELSRNIVAANVTATIDATLTLGAISEIVQVTSEAPSLQADSATLGPRCDRKADSRFAVEWPQSPAVGDAQARCRWRTWPGPERL